MATSEIEKLERRYAENPHGLTFAPLAEVHRKIGDIPRALELLTAGLELHPNYIPASIVLGRCHQDQGDLAAAEAAFAHVLRLDDENVIALKSLADINERQERYTEALATLRRLVAIDRSNEEAREQLERVQAAMQSHTEIASPATARAEPADPAEAAPAAPVAAAPAAPVEAAQAEAAPAAALKMIDLTPEPASVPAESGTLATAEPEPEPSPREDRSVISEPEVIYEPPALPSLVRSEQAAAEPAASSDTPRHPVEPAPDEPAVQPLPGLISAEFQPPLEATGGLGVEMSEDVVLEVSGDSEFSVPDASEDLKSLAARLSAPRTPTPVEATPTPPTPIQEPEPASRIREPEAGPVGLPSKRPSYRASDTNGQSVGAFFRALLAARVAGAGTPGNGEITGRAESSATASNQNGSGILESSYGEVNLPVPPAVPSEPPTEAAVSFDEFFNSESGKSTPLRHGQSETGKDDLDQFQTWLQNLKR